MIIDAHYHLDERIETVDTLIEKMNQASIDKTALIPTLVDPFTVGPVAEGLSGLIRKSLMSGFVWPGLLAYRSTVTGKGRFKILNRTYSIYVEPDNGQVAPVLAAYPDRFYGWIFVNPSVSDPIKEIEHRRATPGWIGVKCHPFWHCYPVNHLDATAAYCEAHGLPLLIHLGGGKARGNFTFLPERYPELKVIYAHAGIPYYRSLWSDIRDRKNVFVDLSSPYLDESLRGEAVKVLGGHKCIYGSDGPYGYHDKDGGYDHGAILREIHRLPVSSGDKEKILGGNFQQLMEN